MNLFSLAFITTQVIAPAEAPPAPPPAPPVDMPVPPPPPPPPAAFAPPPAAPRDEVLLGDDIEHGGYGGPFLSFSRILDSDAVFVGGRGGWIANHVLVLGAAGQALITPIDAPAGVYPADEDWKLRFGYGGLWLEYLVFPRKVVHGSVGTLVGAGSLSYRQKRSYGAGPTDDGGVAFVVEPIVSLEVNVIRFFRIAIGGSYRLVRGVDIPGLENGDLSGPAGTVVLKFGNF